jgi:uncharacterized protein
MTDTLYPATTITSHESAHAPLVGVFPLTHKPRYVAPAVDGTQEDDGQISCFCGFADDDGNTVACDACNRWNHTICYYPEYAERTLPESLQHFCVECRPREVDRAAAYIRQRNRREEQDQAVNGTRRQAGKSHKKKSKEPGAVPHTNGWPLDKARQDRNSASPRDQPPPAKRPKTSHRTSDSSTPAAGKGHSRKRTVTNASQRRSVSRSPETPVEKYSPEFIHQNANDTWSYTEVNLHNDIRVTNQLADFLHKPNEAFINDYGVDRGMVMMRWDHSDLEGMPGRADYEIQDMYDDSYVDPDGHRATWKSVVLRGEASANSFVGELRGHIGLKEDYKKDAGNRWSVLRHPEPFVFFHPFLPIYIDARHEGTDMRYVRRSCTPNLELKILITDGNNYRFCFITTHEVPPGTELTIGWDTPQVFDPKDSHSFAAWTSTVLANCGPCACCLSPPHTCNMAHFASRTTAGRQPGQVPPTKMPKSKKKKLGPHVSPLDTQTLNSRSGSEARKVDADDEPTDSRSTSGSGGRGSTSRDITPNTHYSTNGSHSAVPELSERERKKLAKEEEMFRRQEEERNGRGKKKRGSAGSALSTPVTTSSKPLAVPASKSGYSDAGTGKQCGLPPVKAGPGRRGRPPSQKAPAKPYVKVVKRPKPQYVDAEVQCDMDQEEAEGRAQASPRPKRRFVSTQQRLLERAAQNYTKYRNSLKSASSASPATAGAMEIDYGGHKPQSPVSPRTRESPVESPKGTPPARPGVAEDVEMHDAPVNDDSASSPSHPGQDIASPKDEMIHMPPGPATPPSPPKVEEAPPPGAQKSVEMHLQMPPPPKEFNVAQGALPVGTPNSVTGSLAQSPANILSSGPMLSPSVTAAVTPGSSRKKMSLSDYTRKKAKDKEHEAKERESSPASVTSGPTWQATQPASDTPGRGPEGTAPDEVKMEVTRA